MEKTASLRRLENLAVVAFMVASVVCLPSALLAKTRPNSTVVTATNAVIDFGSFSVLPSCSNCFITISPTGVRTASAGIVLTSAQPGQAATYSVMATCQQGACDPYTVAATPSSASLTTGMTVSAFTFQQSATLPPNTLSVGATLTILGSASAAAGSYPGAAFTITTTPP